MVVFIVMWSMIKRKAGKGRDWTVLESEYRLTERSERTSVMRKALESEGGIHKS